jgi:opacity protein-like surface antigen
MPRFAALKIRPILLLAATAAGALAPVTAAAVEFELADLNTYDSPSLSNEQVTSISQFTDLRPTDWAYQALTNLVEKYGCVAGYPNGSFRGGQAMTRFEATALLNACLDRVTEVTDTLKRLMAEFAQELAVLKGRVDGLEAKAGQIEASQFSTTTKLSGLASFVVGGVSNNPAGEQVTFNYDLQLNLDTSFSGKDLLRTVLRAGNFDGDRNAFGGDWAVFDRWSVHGHPRRPGGPGRHARPLAQRLSRRHHPQRAHPQRCTACLQQKPRPRPGPLVATERLERER